MSESVQAKLSVQRSASSASDIPHISTPESEKQTETDGKIKKSVSMDSTEADKTSHLAYSGSFKRRSIRRRPSKRLSRPEPEYGQDTEAYEKIRERVFQERAVTNAIEALQERWRMIMFMYDDLVDLNEERKSKKLKKLSIKRQFELIVVIAAFVLICLPISIIFVLLT